jgi:threonylcarbamoyladenosine tRNA methylthiotransferase MtaB
VDTFFLRNFGCRATQAEGAALEAELLTRGFAPADRRAADLVILNSCTVTASADEDLRQAVRQVRRENPEARIVVTGCYAQRAPQELAALPGVAWVVGNTHKGAIPALLTSPQARPSAGHSLIQVGDIFAQQEFLGGVVEDAAGDRTRPNLKIQDGCNHRCSFCIIPSVRGRSRSARPEWVIAQVRRLSAYYREVVLSGINLGGWGRDLSPRMHLAELLRRLLEETGIERLRLSSLEPLDLSDELLGLMASSPRIARHLHVPLQSGSDTVLARMRRNYRARQYQERIHKARHSMLEAAIGADVMTGSPGETEEEFEQTRRFIESLPLTYLHVFTYSARPGTPAAAAPLQVPVPVRKQRNRILRELGAAKNLAFRRAMVGKKLSVVTLAQTGVALSDNYLKVALAQPRASNRLIDVEIGGITPQGLSEVPTSPGGSRATSTW